MTASILHADLDAFYASVEQRDNPSLRGLPVIVGGGVVLAASYEAKAYGIRTAMGGRHARLLCPQAVVVPPRMAAYSQASKDVFAVFADTTPVVEGISIDEAFLDVSGLARLVGSPMSIAANLRARVAAEVGLPITVGVARTKFMAKIASAVAKPDGLLEVQPDRELEFLHPLPVERMWGVGKVTAAALHSAGIATIGDLAAHRHSALVTLLGTGAAEHLHALSHGIDHRVVRTGVRQRSVGAQHALGRRPHTHHEIDATLAALVDRVSYRLRRSDRTGRTITLRLRFGDYTRATRSHTVAHPTAQTDVLLAAARGLLTAAAPLIEKNGLTLVGVAVSNISSALTVQLELPFDTAEADLDRARDEVVSRFGTSALLRASRAGEHRQ